MFRAVILAAIVASISAQTCVPPDVVYTEIGENLYRTMLCDLNVAENAAAQISTTAQSACTKFENIDFFTQLLITINADNAWLDQVGAGSAPSGDECIGVNLRIDFDLKNIQGKSNTPVSSTDCPPKSFGAAHSQYTVQRFGKILAALAAAPAGPTPPGTWQKYVEDINNGIAAVRAVITANNAAGCLAATQTLANALKGIRSSCVITTTPSSTTTLAYSG